MMNELAWVFCLLTVCIIGPMTYRDALTSSFLRAQGDLLHAYNNFIDEVWEDEYSSLAFRYELAAERVTILNYHNANLPYEHIIQRRLHAYYGLAALDGRQDPGHQRPATSPRFRR